MKNKMLVSILSILLLWVSLFSPSVFSQGPVVRIEPAVTPSDVGDTFPVDIVIKNGQHIAGCQVWLTYNPAALEYVAFEEGTFFPDDPDDTFYGKMHRDEPSATEKRLRFAVVTSPLSQHNGDGTIITLSFRILDVNESALFNLVEGNLSSKTGTLLFDTDANLSVPRVTVEEPSDVTGEEPSDVTGEEPPDLIVESIQVRKFFFDTGDQFILTTPEAGFLLIATLKNKGGGRADAPIHYRWYRSKYPNYRSLINTNQVAARTLKPEEISEEHTADRWIAARGERENVTLAADQSSDQLIVITAPEEPGIYYYHVCVVSIATEHDKHNNCSDDVKITVLPDLTGDGKINENDFLIVVAQFGLKSAPATTGDINDITDPTLKTIYEEYDTSGVISDLSIAVKTHADLNADGTVNFLDILLMANALEDEGVFAAPNVARLTPGTVEQWLAEAKQMWESDPAFSHGIAALEQFHTRLPPMATALLSNYPNPFNPETWIPYHLAKPADVTLTIYDVNGHIVRALDLGNQRAGRYQDRARAAYWDGRNTHGEAVASGVYFYMLSTGDFTATRRMLIRK